MLHRVIKTQNALYYNLSNKSSSINICRQKIRAATNSYFKLRATDYNFVWHHKYIICRINQFQNLQHLLFYFCALKTHECFVGANKSKTNYYNAAPTSWILLLLGLRDTGDATYKVKA